VRIRQPHPGLQMAQDPRIPDEAEAFEFRLSDHETAEQVEWFLNGKRLARTDANRYTWPLQQGTHTL
jgi:penicillin-binding protein 1C